MQQWTPSRHVRAIGAWPQKSSSRSSTYHNLRRFSGCYPCEGQLRARYKTPLEVQEELRETRKTSVERSFQEDGEIEAPDDLPLPPILRPSNHKNKLMNAKAQRQQRGPRYWPLDVFRAGHEKTLAEKKRRAPFSTAFAENPYAHALATPVREDRFSGARLPNACLIDLHLVDNPEAQSSEAQSSEAEWGRRKGKPTSNNPHTQLMPLSLVAELVSKKKEQKQKVSELEKGAIEARNNEMMSYQPRGACSYVIMRRRAADMVSESPKHRTKKMATSRRTLASVGAMQIGWRTDMGEFLLGALRKVVVKKMKWLIEGKGTADKPGGIQAMPGLAGLERLDMVDGVLCILRLRSKPPIKDQYAETWPDPKQADPSTQILSPANAVTDPQAATTKAESVLTADLALAEDAAELNVAAPISTDAAAPLPTNPPESESGDDEPPIAIPNLAQQHRIRGGFWSDKEPFLKSIRVPAPPASPSQIYFPTLPYRNRRVSAYNLQYLLGEEVLASLLKRTVFEKVEVVAVTSNIATVGLQVWLMKLAAYLGGPKSETPKV